MLKNKHDFCNGTMYDYIVKYIYYIYIHLIIFLYLYILYIGYIYKEKNYIVFVDLHHVIGSY